MELEDVTDTLNGLIAAGWLKVFRITRKCSWLKCRRRLSKSIRLTFTSYAERS